MEDREGLFLGERVGRVRDSILGRGAATLVRTEGGRDIDWVNIDREPKKENFQEKIINRSRFSVKKASEILRKASEFGI